MHFYSFPLLVESCYSSYRSKTSRQNLHPHPPWRSQTFLFRPCTVYIAQPKRLLQRATKHNFVSFLPIARVTRKSVRGGDCRRIMSDRPQSFSAWELLQKERQAVQHGRPLLLNATGEYDREWLQLHPGLYELVVPAGSGKSQIAMDLCIRLASTDFPMRGTNYPQDCSESEQLQAAYLVLGGSSKWQKVLQRLSTMANGDMKVLQRIATRNVVNQEDWFDDVLTAQLPQLLHQSQGHIRVVVIDTLADLYRSNDSKASDRASQLCRIAQRLKRFATDHGTSILVLNQVSGRDDHPALGLAWAHCCNASFGTLNSSHQHTNVTSTKIHDPCAPASAASNDGKESTESRHTEPSSLSTSSNSHSCNQRMRTLMLRKSPRFCSSCQTSRVAFHIDQRGVHAISS